MGDSTSHPVRLWSVSDPFQGDRAIRTGAGHLPKVRTNTDLRRLP